MKNLQMIASVSRDRGLGYQGGLLWKIPQDMQFFKRTTMGHPIVMGGKTFASIGRALPGRENIVLSHSAVKDAEGKAVAGVKTVASKAELDALLETLDEPFIIGGASLYGMYIDQADTLYLTEVDGVRPADVYFPEFDRSQFNATELESGEVDGVKYRVMKYERKA